MAHITCDFFSDSLEVGTTMTVLLPQATESQIGVSGGASDAERSGFPVLYLLHGLSDDHSAWTRYTSIERYAADRGLAVVMPAVHRSFYADEAQGHRYWTFVSEELPRVVESFFRISPRREDTFVAGLSMGGYGALKLALSQPERFAAAASLSGAVDVRSMASRPERAEIVRRVFGDEFKPSDDLYQLLAAADPATLPRLFIACGTEEERLPEANTRLIEQARARGIEVTTDFRPGVHEWGLWDDVIQDVIAWLPLDADD
jgi:S-formylglutathione hydrolase FrmB